MRKAIISLLMFISAACYAQSPFIKLNQERYSPGDSLKFDCNLPDYKTEDTRLASLYLFVENIATRQRWNYRYPLVNGACIGTLLINDKLSPGKYAFSFLVRKTFFSLRGKVEKEAEIDMTYSMKTMNNTSFSDKIKTDKNGRFSLQSVLFEDSSYFIFLPHGRKTQVGLKIDIVTPLDSTFMSDKTYTEIISVGNTAAIAETDRAYIPEISQFMGRVTLPDVSVTSRFKRKVAIFNEQFSSGLFRSADERIFDGLEDDQIARNTSILDFFRGRLPFINITKSSNHFILSWRDDGITLKKRSNAIEGLVIKGRQTTAQAESNVEVFLDEMLIPEVTEHFIDPSEVAMIKVYNPPAYLTPGGSNGAIAIYTKRAGYENENIFRNRFNVFGYTSPVTVWK